MNGLKRSFGLILAAALTLLAFFAAGYAPSGKGAQQSPAEKESSGRSFHSSEGARPGASLQTACAGCHKADVHARNNRTRAFLNLHAARMECFLCHGEEGTYSSAGAVAAPRFEGGRHLFEGGARLAPIPAGCRSCHMRNAKFFAANAKYDEYRRRLLEELDVLPLLEGSR